MGRSRFASLLRRDDADVHAVTSIDRVLKHAFWQGARDDRDPRDEGVAVVFDLAAARARLGVR